MKFFFIVGEDSGDSLAAPLIRALHNKHGAENAQCLGVGGPLMKAAGFNELLPMDQISVIGIWEVLPKIPQLLKINKAIVEEIEKQQPDAVITVDFPDFNFMIAKSLKKRGIYKGKIIHYVAPSVWAWRPERAKKISEFLDGIMCLFPMELEYFTKHGLKAEHVGHPLIASGADQADGQEFREANEIPDDKKTIGLFFGSRESEFKHLSPTLKEATLMIHEVDEDIEIIAPTIPKLEYDIQKIMQDYPLQTYVTSNPAHKWQAFKACDVAIAVSGTVALELAYAGVPHIITYKINPVTALILKFMVKVKHAHLANILLEKEVVPEYLQGQCTSENIAQAVLSLLKDSKKREEQVESFKGLGSLLGTKYQQYPSQRAADFIDSVIRTDAASSKKEPQ